MVLATFGGYTQKSDSCHQIDSQSVSLFFSNEWQNIFHGDEDKQWKHLLNETLGTGSCKCSRK